VNLAVDQLIAGAQLLHDHVNGLLRVDRLRGRGYYADGKAEPLRLPVHREERGEAKPLLYQVFQLGSGYFGFLDCRQGVKLL